MKIYESLEDILLSASADEKIKKFNTFYSKYRSECIFSTAASAKSFEKPSYSKFCQIVSPREVPKRKNFKTKEGLFYLLHAICHIEYSAIDLALDICYRFRDMPREFYDDWVEVALDEVRHFLMVKEIMNELGYDYGDIPVHDALFEALKRTEHSLLDRLAVVPRYLEAKGLDVNPLIIAKLEPFKSDKLIKKSIEAMKVILDEEIGHVKKGDKWFRYLCKRNGLSEDIYFEIIKRYYPTGFKKIKNLNIKARKEAGFSCKELKNIGGKDVC